MNERYASYLQSPQWQGKRDAVRLRALGRCEFCGAAMRDVHHVRYPKTLGTEPDDDLLAVCGRCHDLSHGRRKVNDLQAIPGGQAQTVRLPTGDRFTVCVSESGDAFASIAAWRDQLRVPEFILSFDERVRHYARDATAGLMLQGRFNGVDVVAWQAVAEALDAIHAEYREIAWKPRRVDSKIEPKDWPRMVEFIRNVHETKRWGYRLQSRALGALVKGRAQPSGDAGGLDERIALLAAGYTKQAGRIGELEAIVKKDPGEWITAQQGCNETNNNPARVVGHRENLEAAVGRFLKGRGAKSGPEKHRIRLSGSGHMTEVNLWRRIDVYAVLTELVDKDYSHLLAGSTVRRVAA
ncbi:MAG: HNH endonuclease [Rhodospirillales bacterium]